MKIINTIKNIFSIEELRNRIITTLLFIGIFRFGAHVVLPGVDPDRVGGSAEGVLGLLDFLDLFVAAMHQDHYGLYSSVNWFHQTS